MLALTGKSGQQGTYTKVSRRKKWSSSDNGPYIGQLRKHAISFERTLTLKQHHYRPTRVRHERPTKVYSERRKTSSGNGRSRGRSRKKIASIDKSATNEAKPRLTIEDETTESLQEAHGPKRERQRQEASRQRVTEKRYRELREQH